MKKSYFLTILFALMFMITQQGFSQTGFNNTLVAQNIEGLSVYPNPVSNGKQYIYITSKRNLTKKVEIFNVLGKQVFSITLTGKELNISRLSTGVYILKITENNISETRKLVIK
jgi:hypothetical protein